MQIHKLNSVLFFFFGNRIWCFWLIYIYFQKFEGKGGKKNKGRCSGPCIWCCWISAVHCQNVHQKDNQAVKSVFLVNLLNLGGWTKVRTDFTWAESRLLFWFFTIVEWFSYAVYTEEKYLCQATSRWFVDDIPWGQIHRAWWRWTRTRRPPSQKELKRKS